MIGGSVTGVLLASQPELGPAVLVSVLVVGLVASVLPDIDAQQSVLQTSIHQFGKTPFSDAVVSWRSRRSLGGGLLHAGLSIGELGVRAFLLAVIEIFKLFVRHRSVTHSVFVWLGLSGLLGFLLWWLEHSLVIAIAFFLGYGLHLVADGLTMMGVEYLWPVKKRRYRLLPEKFRLRTGSGIEVALVVCVVLLSVGVVLFLTPPT